MQFANTAGIQAHVHAGDVLGNAEFSRRDLTGPAAGFQPHVRVRKGEAQIRKRAGIGRGRSEQIGILPVSGKVARTGIGAALSGADGLRHRFIGLRAGCRRRKKAAGSRRRQQCTSRDIIHNSHSLSIGAS
jgi:hypothetical protein